MVEFGYPDVGVFEEVVSGFKLTGNTPLTSIFPPTFKPSKRSLQDIGDWASDLRGKVLDRCKPQGVKKLPLCTPRRLMKGLRVGLAGGSALKILGLTP